MSEVFWNKTNGERPAEPVQGLFAKICSDVGHHVYDSHYGPLVCARCGKDDRVKLTWWRRLRCWIGFHDWEGQSVPHTYRCRACTTTMAGHP